MTTEAEIQSRSYRLTTEEVAHFDEHGYVVLPKRLSPNLLERLQHATASMIDAGTRASPDDVHWDDYRFANRPTGPALFRINYLHDKGQPATLELLGSPAVLGIAESLAGRNFVPTYEALVFKEKGDGTAIPWHQDAVHPRRYRIFNVDVYLDPARAGEGPLRVAPGSQQQPADVCDLEGRFGWDAPGVVEVEMEAGDILVHDVMIVHGSQATSGKRRRRTIYYEFRAAEQIVEEGPWDREFIERKLRLLPLALAQHQAMNPAAARFEWQVADDFRPAPEAGAPELRVVHDGHTPGAYCSAGSVTAKPAR